MYVMHLFSKHMLACGVVVDPIACQSGVLIVWVIFFSWISFGICRLSYIPECTEIPLYTSYNDTKGILNYGTHKKIYFSRFENWTKKQLAYSLKCSFINMFVSLWHKPSVLSNPFLLKEDYHTWSDKQTKKYIYKEIHLLRKKTVLGFFF